MQVVVKHAFVAAVVGLVLAIGLSACFSDTGEPPRAQDPYTSAIFDQINAHRAQGGLPPLTWSPKLGNNAGTWACTMAGESNFRHQDLAALLATPEYAPYWTIGENILKWYPQYLDPYTVMRLFAESPGHEANQMSWNFNRMGVGWCDSWDGQRYVAVEFGGLS